jgi:hypothetical protein
MERRNSRRRDHRRAQEQAEQEARQHRENPLFGRNLNPDFARAMNTPSEVGGVLARIADGLPRTPDTEGYRRLFTQVANHLLPLAHPPNNLRHAINGRRDARSSINASRERQHESKIRRREEYDRDHGIPARSQATRTESATASTGGTTRGWSRHHDDHSPPRDRQHHRHQEDTCGVSALTPCLRAIQWPLTSRYPMSTNMNLSRIQEAAGRLHHRCSSYWGDRGRNDRVLTHRPRARRAAMVATSTPTLHRRLERLQSALHRQLSVPLRQTGATMGPQIHQAPGGQNSPVIPQKVPVHEKSYPRGHGGGSDRGLLQRIQ